MIQAIELGPFGCKIDLGTVKNLEDIPECYKVKNIEKGLRIITVYIEPITKDAYWGEKTEKK